MKPFTESDRYDYPDLTRDSVVIDGGGFEGNFANQIAQRYGCEVWCYEPVKEFYRNICARRARGEISTRILAVHAGLGAQRRHERFGVKGDQSGSTCSGNYEEKVSILNISDLVSALTAGPTRLIDLLKLNIEGMEYEVLEALLDRGEISRIRHVQIQFHRCVPAAEKRHDAIRERLALTHDLKYDEPFVWSGWTLKSSP